MSKPAAAPDVPQMPATIMPHMALFNHEYRNPPFTDPNASVAFQSAIKILMQVLGVNVPGGHAHGGDDLITWFRHLGFTSDPEFVAAFERYREDGVLRARLWRIYTLCWAARSCLDIDGDFVDIGCYDGKTIDIVRRYCSFASSQKQWWLYDLFDYHPTEPSKQHHGPQLADQVKQLFADDPKIRIVKGMLPDTLLHEMPDQIAFVQVDLNAASAELSCLEAIYDRISVGGMIVLDDYGFHRYRSSYQAQKPFFEARGALAYECPTGQGIVIKRC
jgi:O-methyltransferase